MGEGAGRRLAPGRLRHGAHRGAGQRAVLLAARGRDLELADRDACNPHVCGARVCQRHSHGCDGAFLVKRARPPPRRAHGSYLRWGCIMLESFVITKCYDGLDKRGSPSCVVPDSSTCGTKCTDFCVVVWIVCAAACMCDWSSTVLDAVLFGVMQLDHCWCSFVWCLWMVSWWLKKSWFKNFSCKGKKKKKRKKKKKK